MRRALTLLVGAANVYPAISEANRQLPRDSYQNLRFISNISVETIARFRAQFNRNEEDRIAYPRRQKVKSA